MNNIKRFLSVFVAAVLVFSSFKSVDYIINAAQPDPVTATYDFESAAKSYLDFGIQYNKKLGEVSVVDDGTGNKCLKLYNKCDWDGMIVNFPYVLKNNTNYRITYKVRSDEGVNVRQDNTAKSDAGIYIGKSTGVTTSGVGKENDVAQRKDVKNFIKKRLSSLYGTGTTQYEAIPKTWTTQTKTFTTSSADVDANYKYLCFNFVPTKMNDANGYSTLYIDDITIEEVSSIKFKAYVGDTESTDIEISPVLGVPGKKVPLSCLEFSGYEVVGIYTDSTFTTEFNESEFTIKSTETTYYIKYSAKKYTEYDFESAAKSYLDFGIQLNKTLGEVSVVDDGTGNKCLKLYNKCVWEGMIVNFPYVLKNNTNYRITYKVRSDEGVQVRQDNTAKDSAGIYIGKSTGVTTSGVGQPNDVAQRKNVKDFLKKRLYNLYGAGTTQYETIPKTWTTHTTTFNTSSDDVDANYKYLCFNFVPTAKQDANGYATLYIDDIVIEEISSIEFKAYVGNTESTDIAISSVLGTPGQTVSFDCLSFAGYDVEGIYTDSALTTEFTGDVFTIQSSVQTYYVKYVRNEDIYRFKMENSSDIKKKKEQAMIMEDPVVSGNHVLAFGNNWRENLAVFPYVLEPNTTYALKLSYRSSSEGIVPRLYVYGVRDTDALLSGDEYVNKRLFSLMDFLNSGASNSVGSTVTDNFGQWITKEYTFTTGDKVDDEYKYFTLGGYVWHYSKNTSEYLLVDDIEIKKLDATVSFNVSYDGQKIDVPSTYPFVGDTITLPTALTNPFELEGWYYDADCTQAVGSTLTVENKTTVLYGKATKKNTHTIDFEDNTDIVDGWGNWADIGSVVTTDPENPENYVLKAQASGFGNYVLVRLNYQLQANRIYEISVKYRGVDANASIALVAGKINYPENGMGVVSGPEKNRLVNAVLPFVTQANVPATWQTASLKLTTDQPEITDELKYLTLYFENRVSNTGSGNANRSFSTAYIDDITITDLGAYDPSTVVIEDADKWTLPQEDSSIWKDWAAWITGKVQNKFDNDDNQNDYSFENDGDSDENTENVEQQQPKRKKKIIKKIIVSEGINTWIVVAIVAAAVVVVGGGLAVFIIIKKRKGRKS